WGRRCGLIGRANSGLYRRARSGEERDPLQVVGEGDAADPGLRASEATQARAAQALALELRDPTFEPVAEAVAAFPGACLFARARSPAARDHRVADALASECCVAFRRSEAAVGVDRAHVHPGPLRLRDRLFQDRVVVGVAALGYVGDHEPLGGVGDAGLVAELGRPARTAHPDRACIRVDERDAPAGNRSLTREAQVGLREDLLGRLQLALEPLYQRDADALAARTAARAPRERARLAHRLLRPLGDLRGQPVDRLQLAPREDT